MFSWNDIKINVEGTNHEFIDGIKKYINAVYVHDFEGECDVCATIYNSIDEGMPPIPSGAKLLKSIVYDMNMEVRLDVYTSGTQLWYRYRSVAEIWIDYSKNELSIAITGMPLDFEYYNILIFFLHPLGTILENFGFFRLHSSCVAIGDKSVLITGISGSGKSTSAFSVPTHGGQIIADDLTFVAKLEGAYHPSSLSRLVKLRIDSINMFFPELSRVHSAAYYEDETYFFLEDINKVKSENLELIGISILEKTGKKTSSYSHIHPSGIIPQLFPSTIHTSIEENTGRKFLFITDMLNDLKCYKLDFGTDMNDFSNQIKKLLEEVS